MKSLSLIGLASAGMAAFSSTAFATNSPLYDVISVGGTTGSGVIDWFPVGSRESVDLIANLGGLNIAAGFTESSPFSGDGGAAIYGGPVRVIVGGWDGTNLFNDGAFEVWGLGDAVPGTTAFPALKIDTGLNTAAFKGVDVTVDPDGTTGGTLKVGGKAVLTQGGAFGTSTASVSNAFAVGTNCVAGGAFSFAGGNGAHAAGLGSMAFGLNASTSAGAIAANSIALGSSATATKQDAMALGLNSTASGVGSVALAGGTTGGNSAIAAAGAIVSGTRSIGSGEGLQSYSFSSAMFGLYNIYVGGSPTAWSATDPLFTLGNGESDTARSTALATLKNGQSTLTNKYWDAAHPLAVITDTNQSAGEALVVKGNTHLYGRVILDKAQGDISMGAYGN